MNSKMSIQTLRRLPIYLNLLKKLCNNESQYISAKSVAEELGLGEIQVRKDLASVSTRGKPKVGYIIIELIEDIETSLGYNDIHNAVLVGAGKLGRALLSYKGFLDYGFNIVAAFDKFATEETIDESGIRILPMEKLENICKRLKIHIGIITVPSESAQEVCDTLIKSGIIAIWNFAPTHLRANENILIQSENMASSLAVLSQHLSDKLNN